MNFKTIECNLMTILNIKKYHEKKIIVKLIDISHHLESKIKLDRYKEKCNSIQNKSILENFINLVEAKITDITES